MSFTARNQFSQQSIEVKPRVKGMLKDSCSPYQSTDNLRVKGQCINKSCQKDIKTLASIKMTKPIQNNQKKELTRGSKSSQRPNDEVTRMKSASKYSCHDESKGSLRVKSAGSHRALRKKIAAIFPEPDFEEIDSKNEFSFIDKLSDNGECTWLSSGSTSSSLISSKRSEDALEVDYMNLFQHGQVSSMSPSSKSYTCHLRSLSLGSNSIDFVAQQNDIQSHPSNSDEPLYWPFDINLYNSIDLAKFLCQPPCEDKSNARVAGSNGLKVTSLRTSEKSLRTNQKDTEKIRRKVSVNPTPKPVRDATERKNPSNIKLTKTSYSSASLQNLQPKRKALVKR